MKAIVLIVFGVVFIVAGFFLAFEAYVPMVVNGYAYNALIGAVRGIFLGVIGIGLLISGIMLAARDMILEKITFIASRAEELSEAVSSNHEE